MTNFENELQEMELNWFENHRQKEILESFMDFLKDEEEQDKTKTQKQFNFGAQVMMSAAPDKYIDPDRFQRYKSAKLNIVCLVILDTFLSHNIQEIN